MRVGASHTRGQQCRRLIEQGLVSDRAFLHCVERVIDSLEYGPFKNQKTFDFFRFLAVVRKVVVVAAEVGFCLLYTSPSPRDS